MRQSIIEALDELLDCLWLVARRRERCDEFERGAFHFVPVTGLTGKLRRLEGSARLVGKGVIP